MPEVEDAFFVKNVFDEKTFHIIKNKIKEIPWGPKSNFFYHTSMGRWESLIEFDKDTEDLILEKAKKLYKNNDLIKTYYYVVRYQKQDGNIPHLHKHMDQSGCEQTIDICIEKSGVDWGIEVDNVLFSEEENSAVCFYGQQQIHSRPEYPTNTTEDDYLIVLFLHFVKPEHWASPKNNLSSQERGLAAAKYASDGDVRYFLRTGEISKPSLPEGQKLCECHTYKDSFDIVKNILGEKEFNKILKK